MKFGSLALGVVLAFYSVAVSAQSAGGRVFPARGVAMHGYPKYGWNYKHFDYVNPDAPKGGTLKMSAFGGFDTFNPYTVRGIPAAGMVALPDFNPLLKRLNGRIGLAAPWHFWKARKEIRGNYRIILFGIRPEFRLMGLPLLLLDYMLEQAAAHPDFKRVEGSWVLEDNTAIDDLIEDFSGRITKRYRLYRRDIAEKI